MTLVVRAGAGAAVAVRSAVPSVAAWLDRYFAGFWWVAPASPLEPSREVVAALDPQEHRRLLRLAQRRGQLMPLFMRAPGWRVTEPSRLTAVSADPPVAYCRDLVANSVVVVAGAEEALGLATVRTVRSLVGASLEAAGWAHVHAAGAAGPGGGVLAFGPKGAGKTAAALALAVRRGWRVLAHDRAYVRAVGDGVAAIPWPSSLNIGLGLVAALGWTDRLRDRTLAGRSPYHQKSAVTAALAAGRMTPVIEHGGRELKCQLLPAELPELCGLELARGAALAAIVQPEVDRARPPGLRPLAGAPLGAADLLPTPRRVDHFPDFLRLHEFPAGLRRRRGVAVLAQIVGRVPAYGARVGTDIRETGQILALVAEEQNQPYHVSRAVLS